MLVWDHELTVQMEDFPSQMPFLFVFLPFVSFKYESSHQFSVD